MRTKPKTNRGGFTLVEILTTMAIIAILLGVLMPALNQIGKTAGNVKQKAQFHAIELALETFRNDSGYGDYPPSKWDPAVYGNYTAAQRLAEAIVGRDGFGFHPDSRFNWDGLDAAGNAIYVTTNIPDRKGPYLELDSANAVNMSDYPASFNYANLINGAVPSYVLADSFKTVKLQSGRKTGMPILYYRANRLGTQHDITGTANVYDVYDSISPLPLTDNIAAKPDMMWHPMNWTSTIFYNRTANPNFTNPKRPYRSESFILQSAGYDGKYGTADDVFNFDESK